MSPLLDTMQKFSTAEEFFDFLRGRMLSMGRPAGMKYAEGFTVNRVFGISDLFNLR
jgi:hypothetical protein